MHKRTGWMIGGVIAVVMGLVGSAAAVEVYLNGVQITGARDQVIDKAKVVLDKNGDIYITAPDYKVRELGVDGGTAAPPPPTSNLTRQYFLVTEVATVGATGYQIQLIVNDKFIRNLSDEISQEVVELNAYLKPGLNTVSLRALRPAGKSAQTTSPTDTFGVLIGVGKGKTGAALTIDEVLGEFKVSAVDQGERAQSFPVQAK